MRRLLPPMLGAIVLLTPGAAPAQVERYEVGQRWKELEIAWQLEGSDPAARKRALPHLQTALKEFFAGKTAEAGRAFTQAWVSLCFDMPQPPERVWARSLYLRPKARLLDTTAQNLSLTLQQLYAAGAAPETKPFVDLQLVDAAGVKQPPTQVVVQSVPQEMSLPLKKGVISEGDYTLFVHFQRKFIVPFSAQTVSFANRLSDRLAALRAAVKALPADQRTVETQTLRELTALLQALADGQTRETNYPAARLLAEAEAVAAAVKAGKSYYDGKKLGQFWLQLPTGKKDTAVRLFVPESAKSGKPLPLVVALHGAGGSENLFFDGYGLGEAVKQCQNRGWILVAPRSGFGTGSPTLEVIDELAKVYPVDKKRVFVVGHSMGAMQAVAAAQQAPDRVAAVAALGGGGALTKPEALRKLPIFIGVGDHDFLLGQARALAAGLKKAEAEAVQVREYADVEHIAIVQVALPDVFAFFDKAAK